jgi:hypothetical protein
VVNAFRDRVNIREGYTRPDDPKRKKMTSIPFRSGATKKEFIAQIGEAIHQQVEAGNVSNRDQVVEFLEKQGLEVKRGKKRQLPLEYLKIKRKEDEKFTGMRGAYYRADFVSRAALKAVLSSIPNEEALKIAEEKLQKEIERRAFRQTKRHQTALCAAEKRKSHVLSPLSPHTIPEIALDAEMKPLPMAQQIAIGAAADIQNYETNRTTNPFREIVDNAGGVASQRGGIFRRTIERIRHIFEEFFRREQRASSGAEDVGRIGVALDGCCSVLHRATVCLGGTVGAFTAAIRQRGLNGRVPVHLGGKKLSVTPPSPDVPTR